VFFLDISTEAVLERQTLKATDPYSGVEYHLLYNPPTTEDVKNRLRINPRYDSLSTFHDDNFCETCLPMLCTGCLELTTENCSQ